MDFTHQIAQLYHLQHKTHQQLAELWLQHVLFTWRWWLGVFLTVGPWILWWLVRPKESSNRLLFVMFFVMVIASWLDFVGSGALGLWHYDYEVVPSIPAYIPWDFSMIPVLVALFIQIKHNFNPWIKAVVFGGLFAYLGEPLFEWMKMYDAEQWKHYYSFFIMAFTYMMAHYLSRAKGFKEM
jgi:hypothetical protein